MLYNSDSIIEYLSSPNGLNTIVLIIILFGAINAIFITYSVRINLNRLKEENNKRRIQQEKLDKLYPPDSSILK